MAAVLLCAALAFLFWTHVGYPAAMALWARLRPRPWHLDETWAPSVSVIIAARDEESVLGAKLESVLADRWPAERLEIIVADDGSRDGTAEVVERVAAQAAADCGARVRLVRLEMPLGKACALNRAVAAATGEVLVLTDARQQLLPGAIAALVAPLGDATVGAVSGELEIRDPNGGLGLYRRLDDALRRWEAATGSSVGVTGALWAMRRKLWRTLPDGLILDDLYAPLCVAANGPLAGRVVVAPEARCIDRAAPGGPRELARRVRTLAGNVQMLQLCPWTRSPRHNPMLARLVQHKLLRLGAPVALAVAALANLSLWTHPVASVLLACQIVAYGLALLDSPGRPDGAIARLARLSHDFVMLHVAAALAVWQALRGGDVLWRERLAAGRRVRTRERGDSTMVGVPPPPEPVTPLALRRMAPPEQPATGAGV